MKERKKQISHEIQQRGIDIPSKDNHPEEVVRPKKPSSSLLPNVHFTSKDQSQLISEMRKLLSLRENPSDAEEHNGKPNLLSFFGSNDNMKNFVNANGKFIKKILNEKVFNEIF